MLEVAARDELALRVRGQPARAAAQQLLDLGRADPVVLRVVEHRQKHVEVRQQLGEPQRAAVEPQRRRPTRLSRRVDRDLIAERLEQPPHELLAAAEAPRAATPRAGRGRRQFRTAGHPPSQSEHLHERHTSIDEATYGRSLTYWASANPGAAALRAPARPGRPPATAPRCSAPRPPPGRRRAPYRTAARSAGPGPGACAAGSRGRSRAGGSSKWSAARAPRP